MQVFVIFELLVVAGILYLIYRLATATGKKLKEKADKIK